jgi:hypothetical protein
MRLLLRPLSRPTKEDMALMREQIERGEREKREIGFIRCGPGRLVTCEGNDCTIKMDPSNYWDCLKPTLDFHTHPTGSTLVPQIFSANDLFEARHNDIGNTCIGWQDLYLGDPVPMAKCIRPEAIAPDGITRYADRIQRVRNLSGGEWADAVEDIATAFERRFGAVEYNLT